MALLAALLLGSSVASAQIAVGDTGSPTYNHPIAVPPGVSGLTPKLSFFYSGGSVNGPVGLGWSIQGSSSITRCPATRATDGVRSGVIYGPTDKLCLDGQRLIQTDAAGTPLATQSDDSRGPGAGVREYRTEKDSYARIRAYGIANGSDANGPAYFKVWTKSGLIYEYGASPASDANTKALIAAQGKSAGMVWAVSRISDTAGNYMDFKYEVRDVPWGSGPSGGPMPGREWNLIEIQYTGRSGQAPTNKVIFSYVDRSGDRAEAYHQGSKNVSVRRLESIRTYVNSPNPTVLGPAATAVKVKTTKLAYQTGTVTGRSVLSAITECAGAAETNCLPSTTFTYSAGGNEAYQVSTGFKTTALPALPMHSVPGTYGVGTYGVLTGDFDGDGRTDIIRWSDTPAENQLWLSNGDGSFRQVTNGTAAGQFNMTSENLFRSQGCFHSTVTDFNGDGLSDVLRVADNTGVNCTQAGTNYLYLSNGDGSFNRVLVTGPSLRRKTSKPVFDCLLRDPVTNECREPGNKEGWTDGATYYILDVDADGILDVVTTTLPSQAPVQVGKPPSSADACLTTICTRVYKGSTTGAFTEISTNVANKSLYATPPQYVLNTPSTTVDVDGDGLTDIVGVSTAYFQLPVGWRSRGDGNFDPISSVTPTDFCSYPIDVNGDARADCIVVDSAFSPATSNVLRVTNGISLTNVSSFNLNVAGNEFYTVGTSGRLSAGIAVADLNGDGRHDLLRWKDNVAENVIYLSNGDGSFRTSTSFNVGTANQPLRHSDGSSDFVLGDFTGRGSIEILRLKASPSVGNDFVSNALFVRSNPTPPDQLTSVRSSSGLVATLTYQPLSNAGGGAAARYVTDRRTANAATFPLLDITAPIYVVTSQRTDSGVGTGFINSEFSYRGLKADLNGRGLLGFREVRLESQGANGEQLTVMTRYLQAHPYIGAASRTETRRGRIDNPSAALLSSVSNIYCDLTAAAGAEALATEAAPCPTSAKVQRPYIRQSIESGTDLGGAALPGVTTTNSYNSTGDPTAITVVTTGTIAGIAETHTKTTTNTYYPNSTAGDNWILGRLQRASVRNQVPNSIGGLAAGAGIAPNAAATAGTKQPLTVSISPKPVSASQATAGALSANASASVGSYPTPPITYAWSRVGGTTLITASPASGTANTTTFSANLGLGQSANETWQVTATDATGRSGSDTVNVSFVVTTSVLSITQVAPSAPSASRNNPGPISTSAAVSTTGGQAPLTYNWTRLTGSRITVSNAATATATFSATLGWGENLSESFQIEVRDAVGQIKTASVTVTFTSPVAPVVALNPTALSISSTTPGGTASGSVTASGSGGVPPYTYAWSRVTGSRIAVSGTQTGSFSTTVNYNDNFVEQFLMTMTDAAGNPATQTLNVTAVGPAYPPPAVSVNPTTYGFGSVAMDVTATTSITVTNNGGPGVFSLSLSSSEGGRFSVNGGTCPANGGTVGPFTSCVINVSYYSFGQCGGTIQYRNSTLTVSGGSSSATVALTGQDRVYSLTSPQCQ